MSSVTEELETIRQNHNGVLFPEDVVEYARDPDTELHKKFDWDNDTAAEKYRIWQARQIIRVSVTILNRDNITVQTYVSLKQDRYSSDEDGKFMGGYRHTLEVLKTPSLRKTLLEEAIEEHDAWEAKYQTIKELAEIFAAARTVKQKQELMPAMA